MAAHMESPWKMPEDTDIVEGGDEANVLYPDVFSINTVEDTLSCRFTSVDHENNMLGLESEFINEIKFSKHNDTYLIQFTRPNLSDLIFQFMILEELHTVSMFDEHVSIKLNISEDMYSRMVDYITDNLGDPAAIPAAAPVVPVAPEVPAVPAVPAEPAQNPNNYPIEPINLAPPELNEHGMPVPGPNGRKERKRNGKSKRRGAKKQRKTRRHRKY